MSTKVPKYIAIKYCTKDQKYRFQCIHIYGGDVRDGVCGFYATLYAEYRFHVGDVEDTLYSVYSGPSPRQEGRLIVAVHPVGLAVHYHAVQGGSFILKCSGTCQTTRVIAGKTHSQSPILKCYGVLSNPVILTKL